MSELLALKLCMFNSISIVAIVMKCSTSFDVSIYQIWYQKWENNKKNGFSKGILRGGGGYHFHYLIISQEN